MIYAVGKCPGRFSAAVAEYHRPNDLCTIGVDLVPSPGDLGAQRIVLV